MDSFEKINKYESEILVSAGNRCINESGIFDTCVNVISEPGGKCKVRLFY